MLKIRSTPTDVEQTGHMKDYLTEIRKSESRAPAIPNTVRDSIHENSLENISPDHFPCAVDTAQIRSSLSSV